MLVATASAPFSVVVMSPEQFVHRLNARGLTLRCESGKLILLGPNEARTDKIRTYLRTQKESLIEHLSPAVDGPDVSDLAALGAEIDREIEADMAA